MKIKLNITYTKKELIFLKEHHCKILSEINLSKTGFSDDEIPRRMFKYGGTYITEIIDDETNKEVQNETFGYFKFLGVFDS